MKRKSNGKIHLNLENAPEKNDSTEFYDFDALANSQYMENSELSEYYTPLLNLSCNSDNRLKMENDDNRVENYENNIILEQNETEEESKENFIATPQIKRNPNVNARYNTTTLCEDKQVKTSIFCGFCRAPKEAESIQQNGSGACNIF